jgi:hypothetical protein
MAPPLRGRFVRKMTSQPLVEASDASLRTDPASISLSVSQKFSMDSMC